MSPDWHDANNTYLAAALHWLRLTLRRQAASADDRSASRAASVTATGEPAETQGRQTAAGRP